MKILIVEDSDDIAEFIKVGFQSEGYIVDIAFDGERGSFMARTNSYDAVILDNSLPKKHGIDICKEIRKAGVSIPIIFLSVIGDIKKKIEALEAGADDYLTKPFHFEELSARMKALLRRPPVIEDPVLVIGELTLDTDKHIAYRGEQRIYLTRKEYSLLEYLMRNPDNAVSRSMIMEHVWNADSDPFSNTIEAHILNLRRKVNVGDKRDIIKNIPGRGYMIEP